MTSQFDTETAVTPIAPGRYAAAFGPGWVVGRAINGGLSMATATRAALAALNEPEGHQRWEPLTVAACFLTPSQQGPVELETEVLRAGRSYAAAQVSLRQPAPEPATAAPVERLRVLVTAGTLPGADVSPQRSVPAPTLPDPADCLGPRDAAADFLPGMTLMDRVDLRLDPTTASWAMGRPTGKGVLRGWLSLADGREPDPLSLIWALDALPPSSFDLGIPGWAPTIELTAHVRARPVPGPLRVEITTRTLYGELLEEDALIWDAAGRLVAQSRQLAGVRPIRTDRGTG